VEPEDFNPFAIARLKRKLKRGPRLTRKQLANYAVNLSLGRFEHHPGHWSKPGEPRTYPQHVPKVILELLELVPVEAVRLACGALGHPSFWLDVGPRYRCICNDFSYKD
jgi:hypothetical protein